METGIDPAAVEMKATTELAGALQAAVSKYIEGVKATSPEAEHAVFTERFPLAARAFASLESYQYAKSARFLMSHPNADDLQLSSRLGATLARGASAWISINTSPADIAEAAKQTASFICADSGDQFGIFHSTVGTAISLVWTKVYDQERKFGNSHTNGKPVAEVSPLVNAV